MLRSDVAVVFDMDGTLTRPMLDFDEIRGEIGLGPGPILEVLPTLSPEDRARAEAVLVRHEADAAAHSQLRDGARKALAGLRDARVPVALMTRNSRQSVRTFLEKHDLVFEAIRTREDGGIKPAPDALLSILAELGVAPENAWSVGDYKFDILCGKNAGTRTIMFAPDGQRPDGHLPDGADLADHVIADLESLLPLVLDCSPPPAAQKSEKPPRCR